MTDKALKDTKDKPALAEFPLSAIEAGMRAFEYGKKKYDRFDWLKGHSANDLICAIIRHALAMQWSSEYAEDSHLKHIDHILANAAMYVEQERRGVLRRDLLTQKNSFTDVYLDPHVTPADIERAMAAHKAMNPDPNRTCPDCRYRSLHGADHFEYCSTLRSNYP